MGRGWKVCTSSASLEAANSISNSGESAKGRPKMLACFCRPLRSVFSTRHPLASTSSVFRMNSPTQPLHLISQSAFVHSTYKNTERSFSAVGRFGGIAPRNLKASFFTTSQLGSGTALYKRGCSEGLTSAI